MIKFGEIFKKHKRIVTMFCLTLICIVAALFFMEKPAVKELTKE